MKQRNYTLATLQQAIHGTRNRTLGAHGGKTKNPFRGIACHVPGQLARLSRHVAGKRDKRAAWGIGIKMLTTRLHDPQGPPHSFEVWSAFRDATPLQAIFTE